MWYEQYSGKSVQNLGLLYGLELEIEGSGIEGASSELPRSNWIIERDGSLRNGLEFKSRGPKTYEETVGMIKEYSNFLGKCKARATPRTSVHIHVNTQHMTAEQMKSMVWLSVAMEPVILRFCSDLRNHNGYCIPVYNSTNLVKYWRNVFKFLDKGLTTSELTGLSRYKYAATGAYRLLDLGTIEYRMFPGCTDHTKLYWYIDILRSMYEVAMSTPVSALRDKKLSEGLLSLITNVILENRKSVTLKELESLLERGVQMANDIARTPMTRQQLIAKHAELFPSKYKPVTSSSLVDLYKSTDLKKSLAEYDPEELGTILKGHITEVFQSLRTQYPNEPAKIAVFIRELVTLGALKV